MKHSIMDSLRRAVQRAGSFFRKAPLDRELDAEMQSHLELAVDENLKRGLSPEEARRQALIRFGGVVQAKELKLPNCEPFWARIKPLALPL